MENIIKKIREIRKEKGISHEAMAINLGISQTAYTKLERSETKLSVDRLYKIAEILETSVNDLLDQKPNSYNQDFKNNEIGTAIAHQQVENLYQENKDIYERLLENKEQTFNALKSENEILKTTLKLYEKILKEKELI